MKNKHSQVTGSRFRVIGALGLLFTLYSAYSLFDQVVSGEMNVLAFVAPVVAAVIGIMVLVGSMIGGE